LSKSYSGIRRGPKIPPLSPDLKRIYRFVSKKIMSWGFSVYVSDSIRTRSRYLRIPVGADNDIKIRLSDHPPGRRLWDIDFDVYTGKTRSCALNCDELIEVLKKRLSMPCTDKNYIRLHKVEGGNG
jgi:hypothetical protein